MGKIRTAVGFFKLIGDFMTVSPLGFIRDCFGLADAGGLRRRGRDRQRRDELLDADAGRRRLR